MSALNLEVVCTGIGEIVPKSCGIYRGFAITIQGLNNVDELAEILANEADPIFLVTPENQEALLEHISTEAIEAELKKRRKEAA